MTGPTVEIKVNEVVPGSFASIQSITTHSLSKLMGTFTLTFNQFTTNPIRYDSTALEMKKNLELIHSIGRVDVSRSDPTPTDGYTWLVTFLRGHLLPKVQIIKHIMYMYMYELFVVVFQNVQKIYAFSQLILLSHCSSKCCRLWSLKLERKIYKVSPGVSSRALRVHPWSQQYIFFAWVHLFTQRC